MRHNSESNKKINLDVFVFFFMGLAQKYITQSIFTGQFTTKRNLFSSVVKPFRNQNHTNLYLFTLHLLKYQLIQTEGK